MKAKIPVEFNSKKYMLNYKSHVYKTKTMTTTLQIPT